MMMAAFVALVEATGGFIGLSRHLLRSFLNGQFISKKIWFRYCKLPPETCIVSEKGLCSLYSGHGFYRNQSFTLEKTVPLKTGVNTISLLSIMIGLPGLKMFNAEKQKKGRKMSIWSVIKVPKQPDGFQCGYYVMKYLSKIIESDGLETITSLQSLFNKNSYSIAEIDHVRTKWADWVQDYMYA